MVCTLVAVATSALVGYDDGRVGGDAKIGVSIRVRSCAGVIGDTLFLPPAGIEIMR